MNVLGLDEAGRGSVVGPLVVAGVLMKDVDSKTLKNMGVKDSKLLNKKTREDFFPKIKKIAVNYKIIIVDSKEIDQRFSVNTNLNQLEAIKFSEIINELKPDIAVIDCPTRNTEKFRLYMKKFIESDCELKCENFADKNHIEVGAASILAKVTRDREIKKIEKEIGEEIGAGYPSDPVTLKFVEKTLKNKDWLNKYVRKTWLTFQRIKEEKEQKTISEF